MVRMNAGICCYSVTAKFLINTNQNGNVDERLQAKLLVKPRPVMSLSKAPTIFLPTHASACHEMFTPLSQELRRATLS
jgi:hypothetical protein